VLGIVPYEHMLALMRYSVAVINPSLFEGWSTVVEESRALGKEILLSDIVVHREQNPPRGRYFNTHIADDLATLMKDSYEAFNQVDEEDRLAEGMNECVARQRAVGDSYKEILIDLCRNHSTEEYRSVADLRERCK
jgi:glycosyltransferase involved in cell wall biosynthesis